jgi:hypothetical protein
MALKVRRARMEDTTTVDPWVSAILSTGSLKTVGKNPVPLKITIYRSTRK